MMYRHGLQACSLSRSVGEMVQAPYWFEPSEDHARQRGFLRLYLYTTDAVGFYARLGSSVLDRTNWRGLDTALMVRDL